MKLVTILIPLLTIHLGASSPISIDVNPRVAQVKQQVKVVVKIEQDDRNRELVLEWWAMEGFVSRKYEQVDGAQTKRTFEYFIKMEECGETTIRATVKRVDNTVKSSTTDFQVMGCF